MQISASRMSCPISSATVSPRRNRGHLKHRVEGRTHLGRITCNSSESSNGAGHGRYDKQSKQEQCVQDYNHREAQPGLAIPATPQRYRNFTDTNSRSRGAPIVDKPVNPPRRPVSRLPPGVELQRDEDDLGIYPDARDSSEDGRLAFEQIMNPVVKIYCQHTEPNFSLPWQRQRQYSSSSSGFAVAWDSQDSLGQTPRWLLTNGHAVEYHSQVRVKRRGDDRKYMAKVLAIGTECDLALLGVDDEEFWEGIEPIELGPMPSLQESVAVVGYPVGGDTISVTAGVVSRIEVTTYVHGNTQLLGVQIDAAINSGNSGGPVFDEVGNLVGIAFQSYAGSEVENVGWIIPTSVVEHFLHDYDRNHLYTGFPMLGIQWQRMESDALRSQMGMKKGQSGILVSHVSATSCSAGVVKPRDVLMRFDDNEIASDGTVAFRTGERIMFSYLVSQRFVGDIVPLTVLRDGQMLKLSIPTTLIPPHLASQDPQYFVLSGLVFTVASDPYLASEFGSDFLSLAPVALLEKVCYGRPQDSREQVVLLSQVLACDATVGYEDVSNVQVVKFNGEAVKNLLHLAQMILSSQDSEFLVFELDHDEVVVLDGSKAFSSTQEILRMHNIPQQMSKGLEAELNPASNAQD